MPNKIVTINGKPYDAVTGLPIASSTASTKKAASSVKNVTRPSSPAAANVHQKTQRTETLRQRVSHKPAAHRIAGHKTPGRLMDIARSESINRFAAHPQPVATTQAAAKDVPARAHPLVVKAAKHLPKRAPAAPVKATQPSAQEIKDTAIAKALAAPTAVTPKKRFKAPRHVRISGIVIASLAVLVVAGWLTYTNIPSVSVNVAAAQAGINAKYPQYHPDGYSLEQPVTYADGKVVLTFKANSGTSAFKITQSRSSWDSSAVLQSIVQPAAGTNYITSQEQGLTVYIYGTDAAWVNGGILYTITGDAPLSGQQIRQIATSM